MSVFVPRDNNRLSRKFEGVASDNEQNSESENEDLETQIHIEDTKLALEGNELSTDWTKVEYEELVAKIKEIIPKKDIRKWKTTLDAIDWNKVVVGKRSPDEVERVAKEVIGKTRRFRILSEMLDEVPEVVTKLINAERPKAPLTAYSLFVKERLPLLRKEHEDLKVHQLFKLIPEQYKALSTKKRRRYETEAARLKEEYHAQMKKFFSEHPDLSPEKGWKPRKAALKTPFHLFVLERRKVSSNISFQQARKEWELLSVKDKVVYIQRSFEEQGDTALKLVNKKEMEMLGQSLGKPEYCGRNVYEFFRRKMKKCFAGKEHDVKIRADYKNLNAQQLEALKEEYQQARVAFVNQYREYIKKLPKDKQQAEIDFLTTISEKKTKIKAEIPTAEDPYLGAPEDQDPPAAESTTIKKRPTAKSSKAAAIKKEGKTDHSDGELFEPSPSSKKKPAKSVSTPTQVTASVASPTKRKQQPSVAKTQPNPPTSKSSDEEDDEIELSPSNNKVALFATPDAGKNGKKRKSPEDLEVVSKKAKKPHVKNEPEKTTTTASMKPSVPVEPEKPPKEPEEFYRQRIYKGKLGKHKESYEKLSSAKKREIAEQLRAVQKQYIVDFEVYLKSLPKDQIKRYIQQQVSARKRRESEESDDDEEDDDDESSSEDEEDED